jgi:hypothetical protein
MPENPAPKKPLIREITSHSPSPSMSSTPAEKQPEWLSDLDFEHELKSAVDNILQACPKYTSFTVYTFYLILIRP